MRRFQAIYLVAIVVFDIGNHVASASAKCSGMPEILEYLERHFDEIYSNDYSNFWAIVSKSSGEAKQCRSINKTAEFLDLVRLNSNNAEFNEFFAQATEEICLEQPTCFKEASQLLSKENREKLSNMLDTPLFVDLEDLRKANCLRKR